jgi:hypothetical protein
MSVLIDPDVFAAGSGATTAAFDAVAPIAAAAAA